MSAHSFILFTVALIFCLSAGMMLVAPPQSVTSLETGLGPEVVEQPL